MKYLGEYFDSIERVIKLVEFLRIGCLPYSHHARARNTETVGDIVTYSGWWGYEVGGAHYG